MRVILVGGFERSGHDSLAAAMYQAGIERGHVVDLWAWRDEVPGIEDHPVFHIHRRAVANGVSHLSGILDSELIANGLSRDLSGRLPGLSLYDAVVSVHPWSTVVVGDALIGAGNASVMFVDCHGEFAPFPVAVHPRVDLYTGGKIVRSLPARVRQRCLVSSVPVRKQFDAAGIAKDDKLVVMGGASGHAVVEMERYLDRLYEVLAPNEVWAVAPNQDVVDVWRSTGIVNRLPVRFFIDPMDISDALRHARWLLTKASGPPVAEGLASRCCMICPKSGVFWEDDARAYLSAERVIFPISTRPVELVSVDAAAVDEMALECLTAADSIWTSIEQPSYRIENSAEQSELNSILSDVSGWKGRSDELEHASEAVSKVCGSWLN